MTTSTMASDLVWCNTLDRDIQPSDDALAPPSQFSALQANPDLEASEGAVTFGSGGRDHSSGTPLVVSSVVPLSVSALKDYLAQFASHFKRSEGRQSLERHLTGLLIDIERKNGEQIAHAVAGTNSQRLQALLTELQWDAAAINEQRIEQLLREATTKGGILVCGETEMQKQGSSSVGVARQYVDALGRLKNCQLVLSWQYVDAAFSWPVNAQVYVPQEWTRDPARCQRARIPEETRTFASKPEVALGLLDEASRWGVPYRGIATTAAYGSESTFLAGLEQRGVMYVVAVPEEFEVQMARRRSSTVESAKEVLARLADGAWQAVSWPRSTGYGGRSVWTRVMCWRVGPEGQGTFGWLVGERPLNRQSGATRYYFTSANTQVPLTALARLAKRTARIEEFYRFAKSDLGWNHYEGRLWHGFHRHSLLVFLAYSFLLLLRSRQGHEA